MLGIEQPRLIERPGSLLEIGVRLGVVRVRGPHEVVDAEVDPGPCELVVELGRREVGLDGLRPARQRIPADLALVLGADVEDQAEVNVEVVAPVLGADALGDLDGFAELLARVLVAVLAGLAPLPVDPAQLQPRFGLRGRGGDGALGGGDRLGEEVLGLDSWFSRCSAMLRRRRASSTRDA